MRQHARVTAITAAIAVGLLTFPLTACSGGDDGDDVETPAAVETDAAAPTTEPEDPAAAADPTGLEAALLTVADIMVEGFVAQPEDDEPYVDDESGGVCVMEFTDVMPPAMQATEVSAGFANEALMTMLAQSAWTDPGAEDAVASIAEAFETCAGEYTGMWGDNAVVVTTETLEMEVPGAAVSVCRYFEMTVDGESDAYGPMCIAASGDRMVGLLGIMLDGTVGLAPEDYQGVMAVAAAKVFAG